jgi:hypothetical protein
MLIPVNRQRRREYSRDFLQFLQHHFRLLVVQCWRQSPRTVLGQAEREFLGLWRCTQMHRDATAPCKMCRVLCAASKQMFTGPKFVEVTVRARGTWKWCSSGHSGSRARGHDILPAGQYAPIYSKRLLGRLVWCFRSSCTAIYKSCFVVGGPGHHVHRTWDPVIISFGTALQIVCTAPTPPLYGSYKRELNLMLDKSQVTRCVKTDKYVKSKISRWTYWTQTLSEG